MTSLSCASTGGTSFIVEIDTPSTPSRLDLLPFELRHMLSDFVPLPMRAVLGLVPQFRVRADDVLRARSRLCEWAAGEGYLDLLKWAHERDYPLLQLKDGREACAAAARGGHLAVLQWLRELKCRWDESTCRWAAKRGHLEVLQWAREHGCPWDAYVAAAAADGGHIPVLEWLKAQGYDHWNQFVTLGAAQNGHLDALDWAVAHGCPLHLEAGGIAFCQTGDLRWAQKGWCHPSPGLTLDVLRLVKEQHPHLATDLASVATRQLARVGDLVGLQWARDNGFFAPAEVMPGAAQGGQLAVLQWARESGCPNESWNWQILLHRGHLQCLKWAMAQSDCTIPLAPWNCALAAKLGYLDVLQWMREISCAWNSYTLARALDGEHWETFEWARQQGCPVDASVVTSAARGGYAGVLQWAFEHPACRKYDRKLCSIAANLQILKVLRAHGCEWNAKTSAVFARRGDLEMLQWAVRNGCPWDEKTCSGARRCNNMYVLQWAVENGCPMDDETREWWSHYKLAEEFKQPQ